MYVCILRRCYAAYGIIRRSVVEYVFVNRFVCYALCRDLLQRILNITIGFTMTTIQYIMLMCLAKQLIYYKSERRVCLDSGAYSRMRTRDALADPAGLIILILIFAR